ncbi:hypothetical protein D1007_11988 [Hordeum vulgare]|nr:hypothetical protein D1007_11988 [Hordeum vulgare]
MDVYMSPRDLEAKMCLVVVSIEPPNAFINATCVVQAAMLCHLGHLSFDTVPSLVGLRYLRFSSWAVREDAINHQPLEYEGDRVDLHREELFGCVPQCARFCTHLVATCFPAEFVTPTCIPAAFSGFGRVLEMDPRVLAGSELATIRAVVLLKRTRNIACGVWPWGGPWETCVVSFEPTAVWLCPDRSTRMGTMPPFSRPLSPSPTTGRTHTDGLLIRPFLRFIGWRMSAAGFGVVMLLTLCYSCSGLRLCRFLGHSLRLRLFMAVLDVHFGAH